MVRRVVAVPPGRNVQLPAGLLAGTAFGAAFAPVTVAPTARPALMTVAAVMAA